MPCSSETSKGPATVARTGASNEPPPAGAAAERNQERGFARSHVDRSIRHALLTGRFIPGKAVTLRGLAAELGVSPMPVREVIQRLAAENALAIRPSGRVQVPDMTPERFDEILRARLLLEPELALRALPSLGKVDARELEDIDNRMDTSIASGDAESYMRLNHAFHFRIYSAARSTVLLPLVESLWLQFAPFMRTVYGRLGTAVLVDHHKEAITAIRQRNGEAFAAAIAADIKDGMDFIEQAEKQAGGLAGPENS